MEYDTLEQAIKAAKLDDRMTAICQKQDNDGKFVLYGISNTKINDEMDPCYQVAQEFDSICIAVCSSSKAGASIKYVDL